MQFAFLGTQPPSYAATVAQQRAFAKTAQLAATKPGSAAGSSILAAAAAPAGAASSSTAAAQAALQRQAAAACGAGGDAHQCSVLNQQLGALQVAQQCHGATALTATRAAAARSRGSITDLWFRNPSWVSPVNPTTADTAAVAVSLTAL